MTQTWADDIICPHFLRNEGVDGKIFEEELLILTTWTMFLQKYLFRFNRRHCQKSKMATLGLNEWKRMRERIISIVLSWQLGLLPHRWPKIHPLFDHSNHLKILVKSWVSDSITTQLNDLAKTKWCTLFSEEQVIIVNKLLDISHGFYTDLM
jgi:hypothetical protein